MLGHAPAEARCKDGCAEYHSDGTGCEKLQENFSPSCLKYFALICESAPVHCVNSSKSQ